MLKGVYSHDSSNLQSRSGRNRNVSNIAAASVCGGALRQHGWTGGKCREIGPQNQRCHSSTLRWVPLAAEEQIRAAFEQTLNVRVLSPEAREFADNYFFETLVRVHRAGEGEAYAGLKPRGIEIEPGIALADNSLDMGSVDALIDQVKSDAAQGIRQRFTRAQETSKHANDSVEAGRQFVAAYVEFIHYVENLHQVLSDPASHLPQEAQVTKAVQH